MGLARRCSFVGGGGEPGNLWAVLANSWVPIFFVSPTCLPKPNNEPFPATPLSVFFLPPLLFSSFVMWEEYCCGRCLFLLLLFRKKLSADLAANSNSRVLCMHGTEENRTIHAQILRTHVRKRCVIPSSVSFRLRYEMGKNNCGKRRQR